MGLSSALATAMSGLRANQAALSIVSGNIANAQTPGYVTQTPNQVEVATGTSGTSVDVTGVSRQLDLYIQSQDPGPDLQSNWMPCGDGLFNLMMRLYWPKQAILDGLWHPPALERMP